MYEAKINKKRDREIVGLEYGIARHTHADTTLHTNIDIVTSTYFTLERWTFVNAPDRSAQTLANLTKPSQP